MGTFFYILCLSMAYNDIGLHKAPPHLQRGVCGFEFVTFFYISVLIFIIPMVPALSSDDMI